MDLLRIRRLVDKAICDFNLFLKGACVLTEAASGFYIVTPLIAALAGARVSTITRDSQYGSAKDVIKTTKDVAVQWRVSDRISFHENLSPNIISEADIVTNLGHVRPINHQFVEAMKSAAVIPLMWEPWEYRTEDLDLEACRRRDIPVMGTDEQHSLVSTFDYVGTLVHKILFDEGFEINGNKIALVGSGIFLEKPAETLKSAKASVQILDTDSDNVSHINDDVDVVILLEHRNKKQLLGEAGWIANPAVYWRDKRIVHICGNIDVDWLRKNGAYLVPQYPAPFSRMSYTTAYLGPLPVIQLHTAGLKVGEAMWQARKQGLQGRAFLEYVMSNSPALPFPEKGIMS